MKIQLLLIVLLFAATAFSLRLTEEDHMWKVTHPHTFAKKSSARVVGEVARTIDIARRNAFNRAESSSSEDNSVNGFAVALVIIVSISFFLCLIPILGWALNLICCSCITIGVIVCIIGIAATA